MRSTPLDPNLNVSDYALAGSSISQAILIFKYRLLPTKRQHKALDRILEDQRQLYNAALESRISYYAKTKKSMSYFRQCNELTELRNDPSFTSIPTNIQRGTLARLDRAYKKFFNRLKTDKKPGFPRFKGKDGWRSFAFKEFSGITLKTGRVRFRGLPGSMRVNMHRELPQGKLLRCYFVKDAKGWNLNLEIRLPVTPLPNTGKRVGIDLGISSLAVLSTGEAIENQRISKRYERELRRRQRHLARCIKGSNGRRKARKAFAQLHLKIKNSRRTYLHQVSARLVRENDVIAVEKLNIQALASGRLAKSTNDVGWRMFKDMLAYKAVNAGRQLIEVNAAGTSQTCPNCGQVKKKHLSERIHSCACGCILDRDHAAALVILARSGAMISQDRAVAQV